MRPKMIVVQQIIGDIVAKTAAVVMPEITAYKPSLTVINYRPGTVKEINNILKMMGKQPAKEEKKYPLFGLIMSFPENKGQQVGIDATEELNIIIATVAKKAINTPERYEVNFIPVLYPIYLEFLNQLYLDNRIECERPEAIPHTKIDFPYYDTTANENAFDDCVDAIQIKIKLKILLKNC